MNTNTCPICNQRLMWELSEQDIKALKERTLEIATIAACPNGHFQISIHTPSVKPAEYGDLPF